MRVVFVLASLTTMYVAIYATRLGTDKAQIFVGELLGIIVPLFAFLVVFGALVALIIAAAFEVFCKWRD